MANPLSNCLTTRALHRTLKQRVHRAARIVLDEGKRDIAILRRIDEDQSWVGGKKRTGRGLFAQSAHAAAVSVMLAAYMLTGKFLVATRSAKVGCGSHESTPSAASI
ncbi:MULTISPECIES: hypothetical protein [Burkholderia]|uniref:hypothetical protein n=1 Tax=Burkholderia TaxID=32008 RepID=UPI0012E3C60F|nr:MULTISPECIES: hypothetical protein [Burkholderia]